MIERLEKEGEKQRGGGWRVLGGVVVQRPVHDGGLACRAQPGRDLTACCACRFEISNPSGRRPDLAHQGPRARRPPAGVVRVGARGSCQEASRPRGCVGAPGGAAGAGAVQCRRAARGGAHRRPAAGAPARGTARARARPPPCGAGRPPRGREGPRPERPPHERPPPASALPSRAHPVRPSLHPPTHPPPATHSPAGGVQPRDDCR